MNYIISVDIENFWLIEKLKEISVYGGMLIIWLDKFLKIFDWKIYKMYNYIGNLIENGFD